MEATHGVDAVQLGYSYRRAVLTGFNLQLPSGRIAVLAGLNGAGKTTLLSLLAGNLAPDSGRVRICGRDPRSSKGRGLAFLVREWPAPIPYLSATEAVLFHARIHGRRMAKARARELLEFAGLGGAIRKSVRAFSKGMVRRLELACLRAADPPVWLLDEPQTGLDPEGVGLLYGMLKDARERGRSVLFATHLLGDIEILADVVIALRGGRTTFQGTLDDLRRRARSEGFIVEKHPGAGVWIEGRGKLVSGPHLVQSELPEILYGGPDGP